MTNNRHTAIPRIAAPIARSVTGLVLAFDIEPELVAVLRQKAESEGLARVTEHRSAFS
jgi:hypothetical protein